MGQKSTPSPDVLSSPWAAQAAVRPLPTGRRARSSAGSSERGVRRAGRRRPATKHRCREAAGATSFPAWRFRGLRPAAPWLHCPSAGDAWPHPASMRRGHGPYLGLCVVGRSASGACGACGSGAYPREHHGPRVVRLCGARCAEGLLLRQQPHPALDAWRPDTESLQRLAQCVLVGGKLLRGRPHHDEVRAVLPRLEVKGAAVQRGPAAEAGDVVVRKGPQQHGARAGHLHLL
eukprot:15480008-Alexandrium_andersonii.AAC.1